MTSSRRARRDRRVVAIVLAASAVASILVSPRIAPVDTPGWRAAAQSVTSSTLVALPILLFEVYGMRMGLGRRMRRLPLPAYLALKMLFYLVCIVGGSVLAQVLFYVLFGYPLDLDDVLASSLVFGIVMSVVGNVTFEMGGLLGFGTLKNLLTGRYALPRREQRMLLLIDMKDSTGHAERLGPVRFHELLNDFFRDISDAALECDAEIHKYVGDEAILTWLQNGQPTDPDVLSCAFLARDRIAANADDYRRRFGAVPAFRAALHCGEIVAGEIGDLRREIAFVGDTVNVAARLLVIARDLGHDTLASTDALQGVALPPDLRATPLPPVTVRGRVAPLGIAALEPA